MDKYLSIITNFGCHYTCPYCIVRENNLHIPKTTLYGLRNLKEAITTNHCNWLSISGGGDPLHNWKEHEDWYKTLFSIPIRIKKELHTSYILDDFPYGNFDRVVYHVRNIEQLNNIRKYFNQTVRVVFVVTEGFTKEFIDDIFEAVVDNYDIDELSFRQMVDSNYQTTHYCEDYLRSEHKNKWWYIEQNDYNLYYAENKVSTRYEDFRMGGEI